MTKAIAHRDLIFWRHADAVLASGDRTDMARPLSTKGIKQSQCMAAWLKKYLPKHTVIVSSPALRALQTVEALNKNIVIEDALQPDTRVDVVLDYLSRQPAQSVLLVGHQPWMGEVISKLLANEHAVTSVKKSAVWWLRLKHDTSRYQLLTVQAPQLLE